MTKHTKPHTTKHKACQYCGQPTNSTDFPMYYETLSVAEQHATAHCVAYDRS